MSVIVAVQMLADGRKAWRRPRTSLRYGGQIGELAGLTSGMGIAITFHRSHIAAELLGSRWTMRCQTCHETLRGGQRLPRRIPDGGDPSAREALRQFAKEHVDKGCRVYGLAREDSR